MAILAATAPAAAGWRDLQRSEPPPPVVSAVAPAAIVPLASDKAIESLPPAVDPVGEQQDAPVLAASDATAAAADPSAAESDGAEPCSDDEKACRDALKDLRIDSLDKIDLDIRVGGELPHECRLDGEIFEPRRFATTTFTWKAAGYCHKPLYFEHWNLERYGHSHGFAADSFLSAVHFFARIPALPYQMGVELPWECVYPLGYYRPGSCAPWTVPAVPVSARGLALEAAAATGIVFLLP